MATAVMASTASSRSSSSPAFLLLLLLPVLATAGDWKITPRVSLGQSYSDNPDLVGSGDAKSSWITEVTPAVAVRREGGRMKVQADYRMTGLLYANDSSRNDLYHGLDGRANAELVEDWFYVDASARISQQLRAGARAGDGGVAGIGGIGGIGGGIGGGGQIGISGIHNTTQVGAYSISPYLKRRLGSFATVEARVSLDDVIFQDAAVSDGRSTRYHLGAVSGNMYYPLTWSASYEKRETNNRGSGDTGDDRAAANARYALSRKFGLTAQAGLEKNDFSGVGQNQKDYRYHGLGVYYTPGRRFSADVLYNHSNNNGNFLSGSVTLNPTQRTSLKASTSQRSFGRTYGLNFSHRTRLSNWTLSYQEDLTDSQRQFLNYAGTLYAHLCGVAPNQTIQYTNSPIPPAGCAAVPGLNLNLANLSQTDATFTSKILSGAVSYTKRRSTFLLSTYLNQRDYQASGGDEQTFGLHGSWNLKATPATTFTLTGGLSKNEASGGVDDSDLWNLGLSWTHQIDAKTSATLGVRHQQRSSDDPGESYKENAVTARLNMSF